MTGGTLTPQQHLLRSGHHAHVGEALAATGEPDWGVVCYFYAAYHLMRAALASDPIFDDFDRLAAKNAELLPEDRYTERHQGRKHKSSGREWGVNELVLVLYRPFAGSYDRLHMASIAVRYGQGFTGDASELRQRLAGIQDAYADGSLVSP